MAITPGKAGAAYFTDGHVEDILAITEVSYEHVHFVMESGKHIGTYRWEEIPYHSDRLYMYKEWVFFRVEEFYNPLTDKFEETFIPVPIDRIEWVIKEGEHYEKK